MSAKREARVFLGTTGAFDLFVPLCPEAANNGPAPLARCSGVRAPAVDITERTSDLPPPHIPNAAWRHADVTQPAWLPYHPAQPANDASCAEGAVMRPEVPARICLEEALFHTPNGRPLRVDGAVQLAPPRADGAWGNGPEPLVAGLDLATRQVLGEAWLASALEEHASVAAFARLALALLSFGAPAELVARTEQAAMQEVEHARLCFALASTYLGTPLGPGPLPVGPIVRPDAVELAMESWRDGCLGEGAAAAVARAARRRAHDPAVCAALTIISRDEAAHAELAWEVLTLCLERGGRDVADALREEVARTPRIPEDLPDDEHRGALTALLAEHGHLSTADRARCAAEATRTAVRRAGWLLAPGNPARPGLSGPRA